MGRLLLYVGAVLALSLADSTAKGAATPATVALKRRQGGGDDTANSNLCAVFGGPSCEGENTGGGNGDDWPPSSPDYVVVTTPKDDLAGGVLPSGPKSCLCVPYYQCNQDGIVNVDGVGIIDIRIKEGQCPHYLDFCCELPNVVGTPTPTPDGPFQPNPPTKEPFQPNPPTKDPFQPQPPTEEPYQQDPNEFPHPTPPPALQTCGVRNPEGIGFRITGGEDGEAQFGEFPWMVAILEEELVEGQNKPLNLYQCGGALITPQVVLTGAHCVKEKNNIRDKPTASLKIRAGEWDTQTTKEMYAHQDRNVIEIISHPEYKAGSLHNDIALLVLSDPVQLGGQIGTICLPEQNWNFDHSRCFASGWGKDKYGQDGQYQVILKKRELPIVPNLQCQELLRKTRLGAYFLLHASFICAGGENGKDTCKGDGGSPLVCPMPNDPTRYWQAGIVAWGIDCGMPNVPGVYGSVAHFRNWIDRELQRLQIDTSAYQA